MRHIIYSQQISWPVALLIKETAFSESELERYYTEYLEKHGLTRDSLLFLSLAYKSDGKAPVKFIKSELENVMVALGDAGVETIYCADANYFKVLTGTRKAEPHLGYVLPCAIPGYENMDVILGVNQKSIMYNPANEPKLLMSLQTLIGHRKGAYKELGADIIKEAHYPSTIEGIRHWLNELKKYPSLACDIETFSLDFDKAGIGTITFCWDEHHGIAFACDYVPYVKPTKEGYYGEYKSNPEIQALLRDFFETYQGNLLFHRANYDVKVLIYNLWMKDLLDTEGLLTGLEHLTKNFHDTRVIAYLAYNSCAGNNLGLKDLAHEFAGNWAQDDIKDIRKIPLDKLLKYNLVDGLSTNYVFKRDYPKMVQDQQEELYNSLMMPSQKLIIQIELTGMPLDPIRVKDARLQLESILDTQYKVFHKSPFVHKTEALMTRRSWEKDYEARKSKAKNPDKILPKDWDTYPTEEFNPNSGQQVQVLLYEVMGLPILDKTPSGQPSTGGDVLEKLINHTQDPEKIKVIKALIDYGTANKVLTSFIPAFEKALDKGTDVVWLHGSFNLGGTVSGRLSSSDPNLQNIPAGSTFGELIKSCFISPKGWIFGGADFNSLEDMISALTTKDPNKLAVYTDGFDGHCLRAFYYFPEELPGIEHTVESINSIKKKFPKIRQESKAPTFLLTYGGTHFGLMANLGWDEEKAKRIEASYHEMYRVSDEWVQNKLDQASRDGYVTVAFGLRLRTPLLHKTLRGNPAAPYEAAAEGRTAGNALGQSYGLLNNRAAVEFMQKVWNSPYRLDVLPVALIHDAIYILMRDDIEIVEWVNKELIKSMQWQELPEIQHDQVKLGAELSLFWPSWADEVVLPNNADQKTISSLVSAHISKVNGKRAA